jgi:hypothetical protein
VEIRAPFVGVIRFDGKCLSFEPEDHPDGVYGRFVVQGGRVVAFLPEEAPAYVPPPCPPLAGPCGEGGSSGGGGSGSGGGFPGVSPQSGNLSSLDQDGKLLTRLNTAGTATVTLSGNGSAASPLRATAVPAAVQTDVQTDTPDILRVQGRMVGHKASPGAGQVLNGIEFDQYGHAVGFHDLSSGTGVLSLSTDPLAITRIENNGAVLLSLPTYHPTAATIATGRQELDIDPYGRITAVRAAALDDTDRISTAVTGAWQELHYPFGFNHPGLLRVRLRADLGAGYADSPALYGLRPLPPGWAAYVDDLPFALMADVAANRVVGLEGLGAQPLTAASHVLRVALPAAVPSTFHGLLDIERCR